ncbi:ribonuclease P protein subunit [Nanoarchaeota archaeon]
MGSILNQNLIGKKAEIIMNDQKKVHIGKIIDETKNTISILTEQEETKKFSKKGIKIKLIEENIIIDGEKIQGRLHERIKGK